MSMEDWAENEIKLACKRENPDWDGESFDYGCSCYQSALKAYKSLCNDGHSGMSFGFTKNILNRLMDGLPLSPITGNDDEWGETVGWSDNNKHYQNKRMSSLFKTVYEDGKVEYQDMERVYCQGRFNPKDTFFSGLADKLINRLFPITMPYKPSLKRYKVITDTFVAEGYCNDSDDYNTRAFIEVETPEGERIPLGYYYADNEDGVVEITHSEFDERLKHRKDYSKEENN